METLLNLNDFEEAAQHSISKKNWAFIAGASNDNITRDANKNLYQKIWFKPRILRNVAKVSTKGTMMGLNVELPVWVSPTGIGKAGGPEGEIAVSKGCAEAKIIQMVGLVILGVSQALRTDICRFRPMHRSRYSIFLPQHQTTPSSSSSTSTRTGGRPRSC